MAVRGSTSEIHAGNWVPDSRGLYRTYIKRMREAPSGPGRIGRIHPVRDPQPFRTHTPVCPTHTRKRAYTRTRGTDEFSPGDNGTGYVVAAAVAVARSWQCGGRTGPRGGVAAEKL